MFTKAKANDITRPDDAPQSSAGRTLQRLCCSAKSVGCAVRVMLSKERSTGDFSRWASWPAAFS